MIRTLASFPLTFATYTEPTLMSVFFMELALTRQVDHIVFEPESEGIEMEVRELNRLGVDYIPVTVIAGKRSGSVFVDHQFPFLKLLGGHGLIAHLSQCDFVDKPMRSGFVGDILGTLREGYATVKTVLIPCLGPGKMGQVRFG